MGTFIKLVTRLSPVIIRILGCNPGPMTLQGTNTYLIGSGSQRILLDTGEANKPEYIKLLKNIISSENVSLQHIIISHWHPDHIGGLSELFTSIPSPECQVWKYKRSDGPEPETNIPLNELHDNQVFVTEGATLKVVHTPGHTTDHVVLSLQEESALFSADCILGESTAVFEDLHTYMLSLKKILEINPTTIYPGHGPVINNPVDKIKYYIDHRNKRENDIIKVLGSTETKENLWTEMDLVRKIYANTPENLYIPAAINVKHHLEKLLKDNKVIRVNDKWRLKSNL